MKILAMFPGQGSQSVGMGKELLEQFPESRRVFEEASDAIGVDVLKLCLEGPQDELTLTKNTQPCLLTHSFATWKVLQAETGLKPDMFAGHSLGEYSALVAAQKLPFAQAVKLVRMRGEAMQTAVPSGQGAMAAVMKAEASELEKLCLKHSTNSQTVQIANYNSPQQLVVAGHTQAVASLCEELKALKLRAVPLPVSAPFHSALMSPAKEAMKQPLFEASWSQNENVVIANLTAEATSDYTAELLIEQIDHPVKWMQSIDTAVEAKVSFCCEIGPGQVLTGLLKRMSIPDDMMMMACDKPKQAVEELGLFLK